MKKYLEHTFNLCIGGYYNDDYDYYYDTDIKEVKYSKVKNDFSYILCTYTNHKISKK